MAKLRQQKSAAGILGAAVAAAIAVSSSSAATPAPGSVVGAVTSIKGSSFTVTTSLSPTGHATVELSSSTTTTAQEPGKRSNLKDGACVLVTGTSQGTSLAATRIVIRSCTDRAPADGALSGRGADPLGGGQGDGIGLSRPADFAVASGTVTSLAGSKLTIKGTNGSRTVKLSSATQLMRTVSVKASGIEVAECAFVRGTSTDAGVTVKAQSVSLTPGSKSGCTSPFGHA
jgi:hypothetical protein